MKRQKLVRWVFLFFAAMVLFTFLSRAADSVNVAKVRTAAVSNRVVSHVVQGTGRVEGTKERAVFAKEGLKVAQVLVREGETVEKGQVLLSLSAASVNEGINEKEGELEELTEEVQNLTEEQEQQQSEKEKERERAEENYRTALENGDINMANAQMEVDVAKQKLQNYLNYKSIYGNGGDSSTEQALRDDVRARQESQNQVIMSRNQEVLEAERALEDAKEQTVSDNGLKAALRQQEAAKKELSALKKLKVRKGRVTAPCDGVVKSIAAGTGSTVTEEAAVILYMLGGELRMEGTIRDQDLKYVKTGGTAALTGSSGTEVPEAVIESIQEDPSDAESRIITVKVPENTLAVGESAEFTITVDAGPYPSSVPLTALYEENGTNYVYVVDTENTVLGEVQTARRVDVRVQDKNEMVAALVNGSVSSTEQVIISCDRAIEDGSRVRLQEN
ncbi:MAG TPA: HlyD family efflux transporter periplasmic adaptor subunit [Candidatus Blautia faecigallinarum]|uniref:HlyD family efflux transporter periplasmic adaptor subunit n=1 Tax=Candidatus Blautia faecigallinarum TaxID=2838488 RepID=A0A9D2DS51_9FIRM|nr:HlyD family efflux transporter periplasmic adaptor subunit [Candidatus Blautia faecigallinarum]